MTHGELLIVGLLVWLLERSYVISDLLLVQAGRRPYKGNETICALLAFAGAILAGTAIGGMIS
jgi:hypothetical protein